MQEPPHPEDYVRWSVQLGGDPNVGVTQSALLVEGGPPRRIRKRRPHPVAVDYRGEREHHTGLGPNVRIHSWCHVTHNTGSKEDMACHEGCPPCSPPAVRHHLSEMRAEDREARATEQTKKKIPHPGNHCHVATLAVPSDERAYRPSVGPRHLVAAYP